MRAALTMLKSICSFADWKKAWFQRDIRTVAMFPMMLNSDNQTKNLIFTGFKLCKMPYYLSKSFVSEKKGK